MHAEADDDRAGCIGEIDIIFGDVADAGMQDAHFEISHFDILDRLYDRFQRAIDIDLDDQQQFLGFACLEAFEGVFQRERHCRLDRGLVNFKLARFSRNTCRFDVLGDLEHIPGVRRIVQAHHRHRARRSGFGDFLAAFVKHGLDTPV